jgi:hypothetical protein
MSKTSVSPRPPTPNVPTPAVPADLADLLHHVEVHCNHAAGIVSATARVVAGDELGLQHNDVPSVYAAALEHVAGELEALGDRALKARTAGGAA